jgi:hypothetical protein
VRAAYEQSAQVIDKLAEQTDLTYKAGILKAAARDIRALATKEAAAPVQAVKARTEQTDPILATWPERIWLQNGDTDVRQDYGTAREVFGNEMSWSADQIDFLDVEYVRADLAAPTSAAARDQALLDSLDAWVERNKAAGYHNFVFAFDTSSTAREQIAADEELCAPSTSEASKGVGHE